MSAVERRVSSTSTRPGPQLQNCQAKASSLVNMWPSQGKSVIATGSIVLIRCRPGCGWNSVWRDLR